MSWITTASYFLLDEWLWNVTWGWYHIPVNLFMILFLMKFFMGMRIMPAVLLSVFSQIFSFLFLSAVVFIVPVSLLGLQFVSYDCYAQQPMHPLAICLSLGAIYFVLHALFFVLVDQFYTLNLRMLILIALVSNGLSALLVYRFWSYNVL